MSWIEVESKGRRRARPGEARAWVEAFLLAPEQTDSCIPWPFGLNGGGYGHVEMSGRCQRVHLLVCAHFHGQMPELRMEACHYVCGNPGCINPRHLRWGTRKENAADQITHGTDGRGERHSQAKLSAVEVMEIRRRYAAGGVTQASLGREYGVHQSTISLVCHQKAWVGWA